MSHHPACLCTGNVIGPDETCTCPVIASAIAAAEARVAAAIRDRILEYAADLDGKVSRSVALTCAGLATPAGLR